MWCRVTSGYFLGGGSRYFIRFSKGPLSKKQLKTTDMEASTVPWIDLGHNGMIYTRSLSFFLNPCLEIYSSWTFTLHRGKALPAQSLFLFGPSWLSESLKSPERSAVPQECPLPAPPAKGEKGRVAASRDGRGRRSGCHSLPQSPN